MWQAIEEEDDDDGEEDDGVWLPRDAYCVLLFLADMGSLAFAVLVVGLLSWLVSCVWRIDSRQLIAGGVAALATIATLSLAKAYGPRLRRLGLASGFFRWTLQARRFLGRLFFRG